MIDLDKLEQQIRDSDVTLVLSKEALLELVDRARGLSEVKLVRSPEDNDGVCVVCERSTDGHTHAECYAHGKSDGSLDENITCAAKLAEAFGIKDWAGYFEETLVAVLEKKSIDQLIEASSLGTPEAKAVRAAAPAAAVAAVLARMDQLDDLKNLREEARQLAISVIDCHYQHSACRTERVSWTLVETAERLRQR